MKNCSIECGVHTLELYLGQLSYADVDAMIEDLYDLAKKQKTPELIRQREKHPSSLKRSYDVHGLLPDGIILQIDQQFQIPSAIRIIVNPSTLSSGAYVPEAFVPSKDVRRRLAEGSLPAEGDVCQHTRAPPLEIRPSAFEFKPGRSDMEPISPPRNRGTGSDPPVQTKLPQGNRHPRYLFRSPAGTNTPSGYSVGI